MLLYKLKYIFYKGGQYMFGINKEKDIMFDNAFLKSLSHERFKKAMQTGAQYILEIGLPDQVQFSAETCIAIGLMTGSEGKMLMMQNWIDDIIIHALDTNPIKTMKVGNVTVIDPRSMDQYMSIVDSEIESKCIQKLIFEPDYRKCMPRFAEIYSLREMLS